MRFFLFSFKGERRETVFSKQFHQTDDQLNIYHLWGSKASGSGSLHQSCNNGLLYVMVYITATVSATQLSSLSGGKEGFFEAGGAGGCKERLVGKASLAPDCGKQGKLFHSCCVWLIAKASLRAEDVACHRDTVLAAHPLCYRHFCSSRVLLLHRAQPPGWCWFGW